MKCEGCGAESLVMKTVRWRTGERRFVLCDPCWHPLSGSLWVLAGSEIASARCGSCGHWQHPDDMSELHRGGRWDGLGGVCFSCSAVE